MANSLKIPKSARSVSAPPQSLLEVLQSAQSSLETALDGFTSSLNSVLEEEDMPGPLPKMARSMTEGSPAEVTFLADLQDLLAKLALKHQSAETKASAEKESKVAAPLCSICFEEFSSPSDVARICVQSDCDKTFCKPCLKAYIKSGISSGYGTCPVLKCPGCNLFLTFAQWKELAEEADRTKYFENAKQILTLQCGNCHTRGTLLKEVQYPDAAAREKAWAELMTKLEQSLGKETGTKVQKAFASYCKAELGPVQFMQVLLPNCIPVKKQEEIERHLRELQRGIDKAEQAVRDYDEGFQTKLVGAHAELKQLEKDIEDTEAKITATQDELALMRLSNQLAGMRGEMHVALTTTRKVQSLQDVDRGAFVHKLGLANLQLEAERAKKAPIEEYLKALMPDFLDATPDQERRSSLHLRYCLMFPFVTSLCCNYSHCFKCKTKGAHEGKTCEEIQSALPNEIRHCPQCNTALVKGDGCMSIRCVCGHSFSWTSAALTT